MDKFGFIFCAYDCSDALYKCVTPFLNLKEIGYNFCITTVHGMFREYAELGYKDEDSVTVNLLKNSIWNDYLYIQSEQDPGKYQNEWEIRNKGLNYLLSQNVDYVILIDSDEFYTTKEIDDIINYLEENPYEVWYKIHFKNLVFDDQHYYKGFKSPRIFRTKYNDLRLHSLIYDSDVAYIDKNNNMIHGNNLAWNCIPDKVAFPLHASWNNYERNCKKIRYAQKRWDPPLGHGCSFKINEEKKCVEWNLDYYNRIGQAPPEVFELK